MKAQHYPELESEDKAAALAEEALALVLPLLRSDDGWTKYESKVPHVTEYVREDDGKLGLPFRGGSLPLIKARGPVQSVKTLEEVGALLLHGEKEDWEADEDLEELEVLGDVGPHAKLVYKRFRSPAPISDREFVSVVGARQLEGGAQLFVDRSVNAERPVRAGCVRGVIVLSGVLVEPTKRPDIFLVTFLSWLDMKGMLPAAMVSSYRHKTGERIDLFRFVFAGKTLEDDDSSD
jgi:hypothetical protein